MPDYSWSAVAFIRLHCYHPPHVLDSTNIGLASIICTLPFGRRPMSNKPDPSHGPNTRLKLERTDIDRMQAIHDLEASFDRLPDGLSQTLLDQIRSPELRRNADRFFRGHKTEDRFVFLFSEMPWVKLVHPLGQAQAPDSSKQTHQVPDFNVVYGTSQPSTKTVVVEVKSVNGQRQYLELMTKQARLAEEYAAAVGLPLAYAVYWERLNLWTLNASDLYEQKRKNRVITLSRAVQSDLSLVWGDFTYVVPPFQRKLHCNGATNDTTRPIHKVHGTVVRDQASLDGTNWVDLDIMESAALDSFMQMEVTDQRSTGSTTFLTERTSSFHLPKLSSWAMKFLGMFRCEATVMHLRYSLTCLVGLMKKMGCSYSYMLPKETSPITERIFREAFGGSWVWDRFAEEHVNSGSIRDDKRVIL